MQEKISRAAKIVINLAKGKGITDDPREPVSWKGNIDPFIVPNLNNPCKQESFKKNPSGRSNHVDMQQRCSLLDKKLKEIEGVDDLERVDPRELCLVPDLVIPLKFKMSKLKKYGGTKCPKNHLATYCNKMVGHTHNEDLPIYVFYESLTRAVAQWYMKSRTNQIHTWRDIAKAFLKRYKYMLETVSNRLTF